MGGVEVESEEAAAAAAGGTEAAAAAMSPIMARLSSSDDAVTGEAPRLASSSEARWLRSLELMVDVPRNAGSETATWAEQLLLDFCWLLENSKAFCDSAFFMTCIFLTHELAGTTQNSPGAKEQARGPPVNQSRPGLLPIVDTILPAVISKVGSHLRYRMIDPH